jgi:hypothetical protein
MPNHNESKRLRTVNKDLEPKIPSEWVALMEAEMPFEVYTLEDWQQMKSALPYLIYLDAAPFHQQPYKWVLMDWMWRSLDYLQPIGCREPVFGSQWAAMIKTKTEDSARTVYGTASGLMLYHFGGPQIVACMHHAINAAFVDILPADIMASAIRAVTYAAQAYFEQQKEYVVAKINFWRIIIRPAEISRTLLTILEYKGDIQKAIGQIEESITLNALKRIVKEMG